MNTKERLWIGRWVRFYNAGRLVIGVVDYAVENKILPGVTLSTDAGPVDSESVLEWRESSETCREMRAAMRKERKS